MKPNALILEELRKVANRSGSWERHAAGLFTRRGELIVAAHNIVGAHAEHRAIRRWLAVEKFRRREPAYLMVCRITKSGRSFAFSKPCLKCQALIDSLGFRVFHT